MTDIPPPATPAGWYPDGIPGHERWWDGSQWTEKTRASGPEPETDQTSRILSIRGNTGIVEISGDQLLYRGKPDRPPLQRIPLNTISRVIVSANGETFDIVREGARSRRRPSLFSETSLRRASRTTPADWQSFLRQLEDAIARAVPKFRPGADTESTRM